MNNKLTRALFLIFLCVLAALTVASCSKTEEKEAFPPTPGGIAVGYGNTSHVYSPGDEQYEHILSEIKKGVEGQTFVALAYDYGDTIDDTKEDTYYVEFRYKGDVSFTVSADVGETEYTECKEILFILTGDLNDCFLAEGRAVMSGMKQNVELAEYVQGLLD